LDVPSSSFDEVYEELFLPVYRFVRLRVPIQDVDDITAEALVKIWRALPQYAGRASLKSWALKIAYSNVADYYRARNRTPTLYLEDTSASSSNSPDQSEQWATLLSVGQTLASLSGPQVAVIQLRLIEGFNASEAADILGITQPAVDSLLYRAKQSFRKIYQGTENKGGKAL
jgi:RNA polymerase sigma-70 factor, ECF subfamily